LLWECNTTGWPGSDIASSHLLAKLLSSNGMCSWAARRRSGRSVGTAPAAREHNRIRVEALISAASIMRSGITSAAAGEARSDFAHGGALQPCAAMTPITSRGLQRQLSGWGGYPVAEAELHRPERLSALRSLVLGSNRLIARGLGRSYGDAAVVCRGATVLTERLDRFLEFDPETGVLECEAGVSIDALIHRFLPLGFFPGVVPGTKHVTVGGAIAADVHGKNHHCAGAFSRHVHSLRLLTASGEHLHCSREENADVFWATIGGMGLTGVITDARLQLARVESSSVCVDYERADNLDAALDLFHRDDHRYRFSVAWIDCLARGARLGRAVLMRGDFAGQEALDASRRRQPLRTAPAARIDVPFAAPRFVLGASVMKAFNAAYYHVHSSARHRKLVSYEAFFFPLDKIRNWNRLYGRSGFLQYQCVLPYAGGREALIRLLETVSASGAASFLAVLKRFGDGEAEQLLSFPRAGYTLALDLPNRGAEVFELLDRLDEVVLRNGGRVYLAKDARMRPEVFRAMYRELGSWLTIKERIDPEWRFASELAVRLGLVA